MTADWQAQFKEVFGIKWPKLLESLGQTVYMLGWALLIGAAIGLLLALLLVLCRKGGLKQNRVVYAIVNVYVNIVRSMPFIITLVFVFPLTRLIERFIRPPFVPLPGTSGFVKPSNPGASIDN